MSGLLACVQVVGRKAAAAAVAEAEAAEQKHKHSRHKKEKRKARKEERKARKAAKRKAGDDGGAGGKRTRRGSHSDASSSSGRESDGDAPPPDARTAAGMDWMSNPAHQSAPRAAPVDEKAVAEAKAQAERDERRLVRPACRAGSRPRLHCAQLLLSASLVPGRFRFRELWPPLRLGFVSARRLRAR